MFCKKCHAENPAEKKFCGECGAKLEPMPEPIAVPETEGAFYCTRHTKVVTHLRCGRCETPICPRCTVFGPAGARCRECARSRVAVRPMGVLHQAGRTLEQGGRGAGRVVWYMAIWYFVVSLFSGFFGGGHDS